MKRLFDVLVALAALLLMSPIIAAVAAVVRLKLGSPIFFTQIRPGLHGKPFRIIKFRTMLQDADETGAPRSDAQRLTPFGRFLRSTSLDELPELMNVLKGEMSLVGPRPLLMQYLPLYTPAQRRRHDVRPGLTGWAQVNGRNALTWPEKFALDLWYVDNHSFSVDAKILFLTVRQVFIRHGINADDETTMPFFKGESGPESIEPSGSASQRASGKGPAADKIGRR